MLGGHHRRSTVRFIWTLILGLMLGGMFTSLGDAFLPQSAAKSFLTTAVETSIGPLSIDLLAVAFTIGPLTLSLNVLTLVGITIVTIIVRSWI